MWKRALQAVGTEEVVALRQQATCKFQELISGLHNWYRVNEEEDMEMRWRGNRAIPHMALQALERIMEFVLRTVGHH